MIVVFYNSPNKNKIGDYIRNDAAPENIHKRLIKNQNLNGMLSYKIFGHQLVIKILLSSEKEIQNYTNYYFLSCIFVVFYIVSILFLVMLSEYVTSMLPLV